MSLHDHSMMSANPILIQQDSFTFNQLLEQKTYRFELTNNVDFIRNELKIKFEKALFAKNKAKFVKDPSLLGNFAAIHNGKILDIDENKQQLLDRIYDKHGYMPILIEKISKTEKSIIRSPRSLH